MPGSALKVNRHFRGTHRLHLEGPRIRQQETNMKHAASRAVGAVQSVPERTQFLQDERVNDILNAVNLYSEF
jgi:hypothetical protein